MPRGTLVLELNLPEKFGKNPFDEVMEGVRASLDPAILPYVVSIHLGIREVADKVVEAATEVTPDGG
jgi:hypothetical protein